MVVEIYDGMEVSKLIAIMFIFVVVLWADKLTGDGFLRSKKLSKKERKRNTEVVRPQCSLSIQHDMETWKIYSWLLGHRTCCPPPRGPPHIDVWHKIKCEDPTRLKC